MSAWRAPFTMSVVELRPRSAPTASWVARLPRPSWDALALLLFFVATLLVLFTFQDYGVTWDEDVHRWYGEFVLNYYLSGFTDLRSLHWLDLFNYGAAFDSIAAALNLVSPFGTYETRHLLNGVAGVVGLIGAWKLGRVLGGPRAGFIAALFLAYLGVMLGLFALWRAIETRQVTRLASDGALCLGRVFLPVIAIAYPVM